MVLNEARLMPRSFSGSVYTYHSVIEPYLLIRVRPTSYANNEVSLIQNAQLRMMKLSKLLGKHWYVQYMDHRAPASCTHAQSRLDTL
jgi:hypothetical protein